MRMFFDDSRIMRKSDFKVVLNLSFRWCYGKIVMLH